MDLELSQSRFRSCRQREITSLFLHSRGEATIVLQGIVGWRYLLSSVGRSSVSPVREDKKGNFS